MDKIFKEKISEYNIPQNCSIVNYRRGSAPIATGKLFIWINNNYLCFFPAIEQNNEEEYTQFRIPYKDIKYFTTQGSISKETKITGGGGNLGGSSIGGAIIGGIIAGGIGAIIGSRKEGRIEPIKTEIITHDNRETILYYYVGSEKKSMIFDYSDYITFIEIIPEKEYNNIINLQISNSPESPIVAQLKTLVKLKDEGLITENEFIEKRDILLNKILQS
ncbi:hypothetical protein SAMN04244560_02819 [Thermoanaerobacter thermohydrosulfuricus]|uniref:Short C-terminal domain-containing protein n=1 Tax=Thermoanaerobacter thermohydrosulfuricus TaxID=1516 RepID=A0A1G7WJM7_THETY|nr:SHOCT domain-containing protein [Thermoanaerobacter thermohydrosulfuricus]SDG72155.1 hypothetical protein SAMN04244560_02819 [Thermoanaerobacter thermohydrosulfuricus]